jgi:4-hydroxy-4-methyl-2-oxoglutarate aldolase
MFSVSRAAIAASLAALCSPAFVHAQVFNLTTEQMTQMTAKNPYDRFPDGRPKVPDYLLERMRGVSAEEIFGVLGGGRGGNNFHNTYADGFEILHPAKKLVGRAFTVQFMPLRTDLEDYAKAKATAAGHPVLNNQTALDMLQPGDVLVVDLYGMGENGTIVGDNLFYYVMKTTKTGGIVVDGAIRDLEGIREMDMPLYYKKAHPSYLTNVTLTGINIPIRIGNATVMPGDVVVGDPEGIYFVPPQMVEQVITSSDTIHIHDEWTRKKFDEGKYKSSEIYSSPRDPALRKEYQDYLAAKLAEIKKKYDAEKK